MDEPTFSFGLWLQRRRKALRLRQSELADRVGCSLVLIRKIEADERRPSVLVAERMAEAIGLSLSERRLFVSAARGGHGADALGAPETLSAAPAWFVPGNLPAPHGALLGRDAELAQLLSLLRGRASRLITLVGPPGIGKTSLAHQAAYEVARSYRHGAWLVRLAPLPHPKLVADEIARVLGVDPRDRPAAEAVSDFLRARETLLILDNYEHVLDAAPVAAQLLAAAPQLTLLVTSRAALHVAAERQLPVPALGEADAAALFEQRAGQADPAWLQRGEHREVVRALVRHLAGIPLAIELAAARTRLFSPPELLRRLRSSGLDELSGGWRDAPARQQTLSAAIAWSYDLLSPAEQQLFRRLAVFSGAWRLEDALAVCAGDGAERDLAAVLDVLISHHLVARHPGGRSATTLMMLELIREFALARLMEEGELATLRERHARHFLAVAERAAEQLRGAGQVAALDLLSELHDNLRAALTWFAEPAAAAEEGLRLGTALMPFWLWRGHTGEGIAWLNQLTQRVATPSVALGHALNALGWLVAFNDFGPAVAIYRRNLALAEQLGDLRVLADAEYGLGADTLAFTDLAGALGHLERARQLYRQLGDQIGETWTLAYLARWLPDVSSALECGEEAVARFAAAGHRRGVAAARFFQADRMFRRREFDVAARHAAESLALVRQVGDRLGEGQALALRASIARQTGDVRGARAYNAAALVCARQVSDAMTTIGLLACQSGVLHELGELGEACDALREALVLSPVVAIDGMTACALVCSGRVLVATGEGETAATVLAAAAAARGRDGEPLVAPDDPGLREAVADAQSAISQAAFDAHWARGRRMSLEAAAALALRAIPAAPPQPR